MIEITCIDYENDALQSLALHLAERLNLELKKDSPQCLFLTADKLTLKIPSLNLLSVDFSEHAWKKRRAEGKKQGLIRACKPVPGLKIIDATAGWGRDASVLAAFGAEVLMLERNPIMVALLEDALARRIPFEQQQMNLSLHHGNALSYLINLEPKDYPDVIYIDPMHPIRTKSALVKKDMQVLQEIIGPDEDALDLIKLAMTRIKQRVVVKWPQKIKSLLNTPTCITGKTVRFDMYFREK
jgi:16S rRNA (guanine1516-N2)-methyltransferase